jgi:hypothetical protein
MAAETAGAARCGRFDRSLSDGFRDDRNIATVPAIAAFRPVAAIGSVASGTAIPLCVAVNRRAARSACTPVTAVTAIATVTAIASARVNIDSDNKIGHINTDIAAITPVAPCCSWRSGLTTSARMAVPRRIVSVPMTHTRGPGLASLTGLAVCAGLSTYSRNTWR